MEHLTLNEPTRMQESTSDENEDYRKSLEENDSLINILNDGCMLHIFEYLSIPDKIRSERVCKRWNGLLRDSWRTYQDLKYKCSILKLLDSYSNDKNKLLEIFDKIMSRCGKYLKKIDFFENLHKWLDSYMPESLKIITTHTGNLEEIVFLSHDYRSGAHVIQDHELLPLFEKNKNLLKLNIMFLKINGTCFSGLTDMIESVRIEHCKKLKPGNLCDFLKSKKNLLVFKLLDCQTDKLAKASIEGLMLSCSLLKKLTLDLYDCKPYKNELCQLLEKQTNIQILSLTISDQNKDCLFKLNADKINKLRLHDNEVSDTNFLRCLKNFNNLDELMLTGIKIDSVSAQYIGTCKTIKKLNLHAVRDLPLKPMDYKHFSKLSSLEIFRLYDVINDNFLANLSQCKQLRDINLEECTHVTDTGLMHLASLPNLKKLSVRSSKYITDYPLQFLKNIEELDCSCSSNIKNEGLCKMIMNAPNLKSLTIYFCELVSNLVLKAAVEAKKKFSNKNILEISASETKIKPKDIQNLPPFIKVDLK